MTRPAASELLLGPHLVKPTALRPLGCLMRLAIPLTAVLCLYPCQAAAAPFLSIGFLNSDLTFGTVNPDQFGYDLYTGACIGDSALGSFECLDAAGTYQALSGPFEQQNLREDASDAVIGSEYLYAGGTFRVDFTEVCDDTRCVGGSFVAPIISLLIDVTEDPNGLNDGASGFAQYRLGPGLFDASIASILGIRRESSGGSVFSQFLLTDDGNRAGVAGDHTTAERQAWDGVASVDVAVAVPEPALSLLGALGVAVAGLRRRKRAPRSSTQRLL